VRIERKICGLRIGRTIKKSERRERTFGKYIKIRETLENLDGNDKLLKHKKREKVREKRQKTTEEE